MSFVIERAGGYHVMDLCAELVFELGAAGEFVCPEQLLLMLITLLVPSWW
ncbi:hypothetical protein ACH492_04400 [Streptomyces sp. NPDC019443]